VNEDDWVEPHEGDTIRADLNEAMKKDLAVLIGATAYVITAGEYSAYQIHRVCRTEAQAIAWCEERGGVDEWDIEPWPLDEDGYFYGEIVIASWQARPKSSFYPGAPQGWVEHPALPNHYVKLNGPEPMQHSGIKPPELQVTGGVSQRSEPIGHEFVVTVVGYDKDRVEKVLADEWPALVHRYIEENP
jgi:hypothetical protein